MRFHSSTEQQNEEFHPTSCPISCQSLEPYWKLMLSLPALDSTKNSLNSTSSETLTTVRNAYCTQQDSGDREPRPDAGAAGAPHRQATGVPHPTQPKQRSDERKWGMSVWWNCACIQLFRILMFFISYLGICLGDSGCVYRNIHISHMWYLMPRTSCRSVCKPCHLLVPNLILSDRCQAKSCKIALCTNWCDCFAKTS